MRKESWFILILTIICSQYCWAQKKSLTHDVYDNWQSIHSPTISRYGNISVWEVNHQEGDGVLYIRNNVTRKVITIARGYNATITNDEQFVVSFIKPLFSQTREAKIKKRNQKICPKTLW